MISGLNTWWRGGLGVETRIRFGGGPVQVVTFGDGDVEPAFGLFGGGPGTLNFIELHEPDSEVYTCTTKDLVRGVAPGTLYVQQAGGGGGWGDPKKRPAEKVAEEVRDGIISVEQAREAYGVALDGKTLQLDEEETARLRGE